VSADTHGPPEDHKSTILIIDDHPIVREGLAQLLNKQRDLVVCGEAEDACTALRALDSLMPQMVIVDISLPDKSGLELIEEITLRYPKLPILALSMHNETVYAERAFRAGAKGYIMKSEPPDLLIKAVYKVLGGDIYLSQKVLPRFLHKIVGASYGKSSCSPVEFLSNREFEIFRLLGEGLGTKEIAERLCLSRKTIDTYKEHIKEKLDIKSATELLKYAIGWAKQKD
jgi:DNA-binding NarL/FixJ family response regulator